MKTFVSMMVFCVALAAPLAARQGNGQGPGQGRGPGQGQCQRQAQGPGKREGQQYAGRNYRMRCQNCPYAASCPRAQVKK